MRFENAPPVCLGAPQARWCAKVGSSIVSITLTQIFDAVNPFLRMNLTLLNLQMKAVLDEEKPGNSCVTHALNHSPSRGLRFSAVIALVCRLLPHVLTVGFYTRNLFFGCFPFTIVQVE